MLILQEANAATSVQSEGNWVYDVFFDDEEDTPSIVNNVLMIIAGARSSEGMGCPTKSRPNPASTGQGHHTTQGKSGNSLHSYHDDDQIDGNLNHIQKTCISLLL